MRATGRKHLQCTLAADVPCSLTLWRIGQMINTCCPAGRGAARQCGGKGRTGGGPDCDGPKRHCNNSNLMRPTHDPHLQTSRREAISGLAGHERQIHIKCPSRVRRRMVAAGGRAKGRQESPISIHLIEIAASSEAAGRGHRRWRGEIEHGESPPRVPCNQLGPKTEAGAGAMPHGARRAEQRERGEEPAW